MDVSKNSGTPKSSILIGIFIINHPFWGTFFFGNTHIWRMSWSGRFKFQSFSATSKWVRFVGGNPDTVIKDYDIYIYRYLVMMCYDYTIKQLLLTFTWCTCANQFVLHSPLVFLNSCSPFPAEISCSDTGTPVFLQSIPCQSRLV